MLRSFVLQKQPKLGGKVVVKFTIGPDGAVTVAEVQSTTSPTRRWSPASPGGSCG